MKYIRVTDFDAHLIKVAAVRRGITMPQMVSKMVMEVFGHGGGSAEVADEPLPGQLQLFPTETATLVDSADTTEA